MRRKTGEVPRFLNQDEKTSIEIEAIKLIRLSYSKEFIVKRLAEKYNLPEESARYHLNKIYLKIKKSNSQLMTEAKDFIINSLIGCIETANDIKDLKSKLQAIKQLSEVLKVSEENNNINLKLDFGFNFSDDDTRK